MKLPPFKKIISYCTSGNVVRDDLITEWVTATLGDSTEIKAYYHYHHGWMIKGNTISVWCDLCKRNYEFKYGYIPLNKIVIGWKN